MEAYRRKRRNFAGKCTDQHDEPFTQLLVLDSEAPPLKKKLESLVTQQQTRDVSETKEVEVVAQDLPCDHSVNNNKLNSPVIFVPSPTSDSNSTIPLEIEQTEDVVSEVIDLGDVDNKDSGAISCNPCANPLSEVNKPSASEEAPDVCHNVADMGKFSPVVSEPPGNFAFINLGFVPPSLCNGLEKLNCDTSATFSAHEGEKVEQSSLPDLTNSDRPCAALEEKIWKKNCSTPPPIISPSGDIRETCPIPQSLLESAPNELAEVPGICPVAITADQDYDILPEDANIKNMPDLSRSPPHVFEHDSFSHFSVALRDREEYIPLHVGTDELENRELELRNAACKTKKLLEPIIAASKKLEDERELLKSKLTELHADMTIRAEVINSLNETSTINKEKIERCLNERNRQHALTVEIKIRLVEKELAMRELQVAICREKLLAVSSDTPVDSRDLEIAANQEKVIAIDADIHKCYEEKKMTNEKVSLLDKQLKKELEEDSSLRRRIDELNLQQRKAASLLSKDEESLRGATLALKELIKQRKIHSAYFVNLERMMVKIKMCRKLKELDRKEERIMGKEIPMRTSNVQYANQLTVYGRNYQPNTSEQHAISRGGSSLQDLTRLQSIAIQSRVPWLPQSFLPLPRFSPGLLQMIPIALPWINPQNP